MRTNRPRAGRRMKVLFAWELGGGLGHLTKAALLADALRDAGCDVACAVKDVASGDSLLADDIALFQAPLAPALRGWPEPADHAEVLLHAGLGDAAGLAGRVRAWVALMQASGADIVITDHAPTAVLAARCAARPVVMFGNGFVLPPRPWPVFRHWEAVPGVRLRQARQHVLRAVNAVLQRFGRPPLAALEDLYDGATAALATSPELDHHPRPPLAPPHWQLGPLFLDSVGEPPRWPGRPGPRVFAYLRRDLPRLDAVLAALAELDAAVLVRCEGLDPAGLPAPVARRLTITSGLVRMADVAGQAALVVCSGSDTAHGLAARGVPVLALPLNAEQRLAAERLVALGVGRLWLPDSGAPGALAAALADLLHQPAVRAAADMLRARHAAVDPQVALSAFARDLAAGRGGRAGPPEQRG